MSGCTLIICNKQRHRSSFCPLFASFVTWHSTASLTAHVQGSLFIDTFSSFGFHFYFTVTECPPALHPTAKKKLTMCTQNVFFLLFWYVAYQLSPPNGLVDFLKHLVVSWERRRRNRRGKYTLGPDRDKQGDRKLGRGSRESQSVPEPEVKRVKAAATELFIHTTLGPRPLMFGFHCGEQIKPSFYG